MRARMLTLLAALAIAVAACTPADDTVDNDDLIDPGGIPSPGMSDDTGG